MSLGQKQEVIERAASYAIGGGGVTWGSFVAFSGELTTVVGLFTTLLGCGIVGLRFWRDIQGSGKKRGKK